MNYPLSLTNFQVMFGLGFSEILIIAGLALVLIGPKDLPKIATAIGRFLNELKRSSEDLTREIKTSAAVPLPQVKADLNEVIKSPSEHLSGHLKAALQTEIGKDTNAPAGASSTTLDGLKSETMKTPVDGQAKDHGHGGPTLT